ncbi:MAG: glycosyltransferase family 4 protein [Candidatus Omnitrophica bacterium]|nr:glycosyltransferase family 4 protein [Candidatus Omnitrophota bacterium]
MKKVLFITTRDFKHWGGIERYIDNFVRYFKKADFECIVLCPQNCQLDASPSSGINRKNYTCQYQPIHHFFRFINPWLHIRVLRKALHQTIAAIKPDIILTRDFDAVLAGARSGFPVYFMPGSLLKLDLHFDYALTGGFLYRLSRKWQRIIKVRLEKQSFEASSKVFVFSQAFKDRIHRHHGIDKDKIEVIPIGFDDKNRKIEIFDIQRKSLLMVGRLTRSKNFQLAIQALTHLPDYTLWIIGHGPEKDTLTQMAGDLGLSDRVQLMGQRSDVAVFYQKCEVFLHLSYYENFGQVLLEAMAYGKPPVVLIPDEDQVLTASTEIIQDKVNGFFVQATPQAVARQVQAVAALPRAQYVDHCLRTVKAYSFERHFEVINQIVNGDGYYG